MLKKWSSSSVFSRRAFSASFCSVISRTVACSTRRPPKSKAERRTSAGNSCPFIRRCIHSKLSMPVSNAWRICAIAASRAVRPSGCRVALMSAGWIWHMTSREGMTNTSSARGLQSKKPSSVRRNIASLEHSNTARKLSSICVDVCSANRSSMGRSPANTELSMTFSSAVVQATARKCDHTSGLSLKRTTCGCGNSIQKMTDE